MPVFLFNLIRMILPAVFILLYTFTPAASAVIYNIDIPADTVIGENSKVNAVYKDTLLDIARENSLGYHEIKLANPKLDTWIPGQDAEVLLPKEFVLPQTPKKGIVLNIPEMRLYYYPDETDNAELKVITFPLGIGREGWTTPYTKTRIIQKKKQPTWIPPESIRKEHEEMGDPLPKRVEPGPDNPLGDYALRLDLPGYLIHGTNKPFGIGMRVSHGCIRLYPEDIENLFNNVKVGTEVRIVNQPYKLGQKGNDIYLEAHPYLDEDMDEFADNLTSVVRMLVRMSGEKTFNIDWELARKVIRLQEGIPVLVGRFNMDTTGADEKFKQAGSEEAALDLRLDGKISGTEKK